MEELRAGHYLKLGLIASLKPSVGQSVVFSDFWGDPFFSFKLASLFEGEGGHSLWFRVHASDIIAAFDLAQCPLSSYYPPPTSLNPSPTPQIPPSSSLEAEISGVRGAQVVARPHIIIQPHIGDYFQELDKERLKEWSFWITLYARPSGQS